MLVNLIFGFTTKNLADEFPIEGVSTSYFGYKKDNSDGQWKAFSSNIEIMVICAIIFLLISALIKNHKLNDKLNKRPQLIFYVVFGAAYVFFIFRSGAFFWLFFINLNFIVIELTYKWRIFPYIIWGLNLAILFCNE